MMHAIELPLKQSDVDGLRVGDDVYLSGNILVGRDQAHMRLVASLRTTGTLPVSLEGETIFYMGPAPAPEGRVIGSCGPTTSARMDPFSPALMDAGLRGMIGKGPRSNQVREAIVSHRCIYFAAFGGCGALYAERVKRVELLAFEELGPEALYRLTVEDFPVIVAIDADGNQIYSKE